MRRKKRNAIQLTLKDWRDKPVVVLESLLTKHLPRCHPTDSLLYYETMKERFHSPDIILKRTKRTELEFVINLEDRAHKYLVIYVKYEHWLGTILGKKNYIATVYATNEERDGEIVWEKPS